MSAVLTAEIVTNQEGFVKLEMDFITRYETATQTEANALKSNLAATVARHRLGAIANLFQPQVETQEGKGHWESYLKAHGLVIRTVQKATAHCPCVERGAVCQPYVGAGRRLGCREGSRRTRQFFQR